MRHTAIALGISLIAACSSSDDAPTIAETKSTQARNETPPVPVDDATRFANDNQAFALSAYLALAKSDGNVFFSPYSISSALAMTYAGAKGQTATEMAAALHFTLPPERLHPAFDKVDLALTATPPPAANGAPTPFTLHIANSMWAATDETFLPSFLDLIAANYGAGVDLVDFSTDPTGAENRINQWVSDHTDAKITRLLQNVVDADTRFVLVDAIYFDAGWRDRFQPGATAPGTFTTAAGSVGVSMMHDDKHGGRAIRTDAYDALELAYEGSTVMDIVMPKAGTLAAFESSLTADKLQAIVASLVPEDEFVVSLPKFSFQGESIHLVPLLEVLGMNLAFRGGADFSAMTNDSQVYIKDVVHKAFLTVNESGTEAAAATAVLGEDSSGDSDPLELTIDHPFFFTIRDTATNTILFAGRIEDPTK